MSTLKWAEFFLIWVLRVPIRWRTLVVCDRLPHRKCNNVISFLSRLVNPLLVGAYYSSSPGKRLQELQLCLRKITSFINVRIWRWETHLLEMKSIFHLPNLKAFRACFCYSNNKNPSPDIPLFFYWIFVLIIEAHFLFFFNAKEQKTSQTKEQQ